MEYILSRENKIMRCKQTNSTAVKYRWVLNFSFHLALIWHSEIYARLAVKVGTHDATSPCN